MRSSRTTRPRSRLRLQTLEDRLAPATNIFTNVAGGDWSLGTNWSLGHAPGPEDDAVITNLQVGAVVTHAGGTNTIHGLTSGTTINLTGGTLSITGDVTLTKNLFTVQPGASLSIQTGATVRAAEGSYTSFGFVVNGIMYADGVAFLHSGGYGSSAIQVNPGGRFFSTTCTFDWGGLTLANGNLLNAGDITGGTFIQPITIPAAATTLLANNLRFEDVIIQPGTLAGGQTVTLAPLGTETTVNQRYVFNAATGNFNVQAGATLNVTAGAKVVAAESSYTTFGIVVNGTMTATGATFTHTSTYGSSLLQVNAGGRLIATNNTFAWSGLSMANGSLLSAGNITGNAFDQTITIPAIQATLFANNRRFQDVEIQPGSLSAGQTATLAPLGTETTANQKYVINAATGNLTVAAGATLNVIDGASLVARETSYTTFGILVNGAMNVDGATFTHTSTYGSSALQVGAGGHLTAADSTFAWSAVTLATGSTLNAGDLTNNRFNCPLSVPQGHVRYLSGPGSDNAQFEDVIILAGTVPAGQTLALNPIGTLTTANLKYVFGGNLVVAAGAALIVAPGLPVEIRSGVTITDNGSVTFSPGNTVVAAEASYAQFGIVVNGTLNITGATFSHTSTYGSSAIQVNAGGRLIATNNTFAWSGLSLVAGSILNPGDIVGNGFDQPITIPAIDATLFADNRRFQDVIIQPGTLSAGQTATLSPMGTDTTATQKYVFNAATGNFNVQAGATLNVTDGALLIARETSYATFGIVVGGTMHVDGATFTHTSTYGSSTIRVAAGGHLTATDSTFAWSGLTLVNDSVLNPGDITGNGFDQPITIPAIDATLFADNRRFQDVEIQPGTLAAGQTATLAPLGTDTTATQKYVFNAATGNLTVAPGAILNVIDGATLVAVESSYTPFGIVVNGAMNVAGSTFTHTSTYGSSTLQVGSGGRLTAIGSALGWSNATLNSGSTADFQFLAVSNKLTIHSGATIDISSNNFSAVGANGVVATGNPAATIDLRNNYWGTTTASEIAAKVLDHADEVTRPTVLYTPFLTTPPTPALNPAFLPAARAGAAYSKTLTAVGGTGPATNFRVSRGALPAGLTLSAAGVLSGTPTAAGSFTFTIEADDTAPGTGPFTARQLYWLAVDAPVIALSPAALPAARPGVGYSATLTATGGTAPYSQFVISAGALPAGLVLAADGTLSGTPTAADGTYTFTVTARDSTTGPAAPYTGNRTYGLVVDSIAPTPGTVNDGSGADIDFQASATTVTANWAGFADAGSGIAGYEWAIGTTPGGTDVRAFTAVGNVATATASSLSLTDGIPYYVSVRAIDGVSLASNPATSDGVTVDATPPTSGSVNDGLEADVDLQASTTTISANWSGFADTGSGLVGYQWAIGTTPGGAQVQAFTGVGSATIATASGLGLTRDTTYYVTVRAVDGVGNTSAPATADGVTPITPTPTITGFSTDSGIPGDGLTNDATPTLSGVAEVGSTVRVFDDGDSLGTTTAAANGTWQYTAATLGDGPHAFTITATDPGGHTSLPSSPLAVTIDTSRPAVTIAPGAGQADPTNTPPVTFTVHFSEPVSGFDAADVSFTGSTVSGVLAAAVSGSGTDYTVTVTGMSGDGTVVVAVPADAGTDAAGNGNTAATGPAVRFDNVAPTVTVNQAAGQPDPTDAGPITFAVHFSEPVTGFDETDVSFAGSTGPGTLVAAVSGAGANYTVTVTGMSGAQTIVASVPAGAAVDAAGNTSAASTGSDNTVTYNDIGTLEFSVAAFGTEEDDGMATVTVLRSNGWNGAISVNFTTDDGTARAGSDYTVTTGTLDWADGDTDPKTFQVPIADDGVNEGREVIRLTLTGPTNGSILGPQGTADLVIARSNGATIVGTDTKPQATVTDADGDLVTLKLTGKVGTLTYYLTDGAGPIAEIDLAGTDSAKSVVGVSVAKKGGDGRVAIGEIAGTGVKTLSLAKADLVGAGIDLTGFLGSLSIGAISNGADITLTGAPPKAGLTTKITAGVIGDGTDIAVTGAPLGGLTAVAVGEGTITAPSVGSITVKGKAKTKTTAAIPGDFKSDLTIAGTGLAARVPALKALKVAGAVSGSTILVGGGVGTVGDVGSVTVGSFVDSELFAGYTGPADGTGAFNLPATVGPFTVTGKTTAFARSFVIASNFKTVSLATVDGGNGGTKFGFLFHAGLKSLKVKSPKIAYVPGSPEQNMVGDFYVKKV